MNNTIGVMNNNSNTSITVSHIQFTPLGETVQATPAPAPVVVGGAPRRCRRRPRSAAAARGGLECAGRPGRGELRRDRPLGSCRASSTHAAPRPPRRRPRLAPRPMRRGGLECAGRPGDGELRRHRPLVPLRAGREGRGRRAPPPCFAHGFSLVHSRARCGIRTAARIRECPTTASATSSASPPGAKAMARPSAAWWMAARRAWRWRRRISSPSSTCAGPASPGS